MPSLLPTKTDGTQRYSFSVPLDGVTFRVELAWNARGEFWSLLLSDAAGNLLLRRALRVGELLTGRYRMRDVAAFPAGELLVLDTSGADQDPGLTDLGARVQLVYMTAAEMAAA